MATSMPPHPTPDTDDPEVAARAPRTRGRAALLVASGVAIGSVLSGAGAVWASHQFPDVPTDSPFHADIDWLVDQGIAEGYADGTFRPASPVSRQAAAAFFHRYARATEIVESSTDPAAGSSFAWSAACPTGKTPVAGGSNTDSLDLVVSSEGPVEGNWTVRWVPRNGGSVDPGVVTVWATCVPF
jgi:hypothetical protein